MNMSSYIPRSTVQTSIVASPYRPHFNSAHLHHTPSISSLCRTGAEQRLPPQLGAATRQAGNFFRSHASYLPLPPHRLSASSSTRSFRPSSVYTMCALTSLLSNNDAFLCLDSQPCLLQQYQKAGLVCNIEKQTNGSTAAESYQSPTQRGIIIDEWKNKKNDCKVKSVQLFAYSALRKFFLPEKVCQNCSSRTIQSLLDYFSIESNRKEHWSYN